jgi:hypothetical protein
MTEDTRLRKFFKGYCLPFLGGGGQAVRETEGFLTILYLMPELKGGVIIDNRLFFLFETLFLRFHPKPLVIPPDCEGQMAWILLGRPPRLV